MAGLVRLVVAVVFLLTILGLGHSRRFRQGLLPPKIDYMTYHEDKWFEQRLDHFKPGDTRSWHQRYWINWQHYKPGGPVLLMIGGEGEANPVWLSAGSWTVYAANTNAAMVLLEHRFYGKSHPTDDLSVKNLNWLSSRQALADTAAFITAIKAEHKLSGAWVALGGSYPGSLAAWLRLKYPHLVQGAVSTSGPLKAKANFFEYLDVVKSAMDGVDDQCAPAVKSAFKSVKYLTTHRVGWTILTRKLNLCSPFQGGKLADIISLFEALIGNFEDIVQYNKDNREFEGAKWTNVTITTLCGLMTNTAKTSVLDRLTDVNNLSLKMAGEKCLDYTYGSQLEELQSISWSSAAAVGGRQWIYQTCTEFGWYQSSDGSNHPFGDILPVRFFEYMCSDIFGPKFDLDLLTTGVRDTNTNYGGTDIQVTNTVFVHGSIDPWHAMGITHTNKSGMEAIFIEGTAHCANMYPASSQDSSQLTAARQRIGELIAQWVKQ